MAGETVEPPPIMRESEGRGEEEKEGVALPVRVVEALEVGVGAT